MKLKFIISVLSILLMANVSAQEDLFDQALSEDDLFADMEDSKKEAPSRVISNDDSGTDEILDEEDLFGDLDSPTQDAAPEVSEEPAPEPAPVAEPVAEPVEEGVAEEAVAEETEEEQVVEQEPAPSSYSQSQKNGFVYTVKRGDTLSEIAAKHLWYPVYGDEKGSLNVLAQCNGVSNVDMIIAGSKLYIPQQAGDSSCPKQGYVQTNTLDSIQLNQDLIQIEAPNKSFSPDASFTQAAEKSLGAPMKVSAVWKRSFDEAKHLRLL